MVRIAAIRIGDPSCLNRFFSQHSAGKRSRRTFLGSIENVRSSNCNFSPSIIYVIRQA